MSDGESCGRQTAKVSQIDKRCQNPAIIKNHKLIKPSFHPFARCLGREFLLFFIDMRGSYVVCDFPQVSASLRCVWLDLYKYRTNSSRQLSHRSRRPERFFHAPCLERIIKMTKSSASMSSLMVITSQIYFLIHLK
jgi:hypothetical protein